MSLVTSAAMQETQIQWRRKWQSTSAFLPGKAIDSGLVVYKPRGHEESDMT